MCSHQLSLKLWALPAPRTPDPQSSWSGFSADQGRPAVVNLGPHRRENRRHQWVFPGAQAPRPLRTRPAAARGAVHGLAVLGTSSSYRSLKRPVARGALGRQQWDLWVFPAASGRTDPGGPPPGRAGVWGWQGGARRVENVPSPVRLADSGYFLDLLSLQEDPGKRTWVGPGLGLRSPLLQPSPWPDSTPGRTSGAWGQLDKGGSLPASSQAGCTAGGIAMET